MSEKHRDPAGEVPGLVDHRSWREVLLDSEASLRLVDTALLELNATREKTLPATGAAPASPVAGAMDGVVSDLAGRAPPGSAG